MKAYVFVIMLLFCGWLSGCGDNNNDTVDNQSETVAQDTHVSDASDYLESGDDDYTKINGAELDYLLIHRQSDITMHYVRAFNYRWLMAYDCEAAAKIQNDESLFRSIEADKISSELSDAENYTNMFKDAGDMVVYLSKENRHEGVLGTAQGHRRSFHGEHAAGAGCEQTHKLNTRHVIRLKKIRHGIPVYLPDSVFNGLRANENIIKIPMVIKFTLNDTQYKYFDKTDFFHVTHTGEIDEIALYARRQDIAVGNPFRVLTGNDFYR